MKIIKYLSFVLLALVTASAHARWLSVDPVGFKESNPATFNRYAYANNNPYKYVDPDGREVATASLILVGVGALLATHNAQAPTSATDMHPNMDMQTIDAVGAVAGVNGIFKIAMSRGAVGAAGEGIAGSAAKNIDPNKVSHIFGQERHNLGGLVGQFGSEAKAFGAMQQATEAAVSSRGITGVFETTVKVGTESITVRGNVVDGAVKIGTAFKP